MEKAIEQLLKSSSKLVGMKQVLRGVIESDMIRCVIVAKNADKGIISAIEDAVKGKDIKLVYCSDKHELGKACNIDVAAAVVGIVSL